MKEKLIILIIISSFILNACEKSKIIVEEPAFDTIYPNVYLPAYPNSCWYYSNGDTVKTSEKYILDTIIIPVYDPHGYHYLCDSFKIAYYPIYNSFPLHGYEWFYLKSGRTCDFPIKLLDETLGEQWKLYRKDPMFIYNRTVIAKDISIVLPDSTLYENVITILDYFIMPPDNSSRFIKEYYYAKNIGLIGSKIIISGNDTVNTFEKYLIDYKIGL